MIAWQIDEFEKAFEDPEDEVGVRFSAFISRDYRIKPVLFTCILSNLPNMKYTGYQILGD